MLKLIQPRASGQPRETGQASSSDDGLWSILTRQAPSAKKKYENYPGLLNRRVTKVGKREIYLFSVDMAHHSSSQNYPEYIVYEDRSGFKVRLIWPWLPAQMLAVLDLDVGQILKARLGPTSIRPSCAWCCGQEKYQRELQDGRPIEWEDSNLPEGVEDRAFLTLETTENASVSDTGERTIYMFNYSPGNGSYAEFIVHPTYPFADSFNVTLVAPELTRSDRRSCGVSKEGVIDLETMFGEPCINLDTAILRAQLWANEHKDKLSLE